MDNGGRETAPPEYPETSRGAGGKMRRPLTRKSRITPYARPPLNQSHTPLAIRGVSGGWLSKIVDPAYRLIGAGATRLLPSLFSRSPSIDSPAPSSADEDNGAAEQEDYDEIGQDISDLPLTRPTQSENAESVEDDSKCDGPIDARKQDTYTGLENDDGILEIEQLIRGKMFSRNEVDRLMEILNSKTVGPPENEGQDNQPAANEQEVRGPATEQYLAGKLEEKIEVLNKAAREDLMPLTKSNLSNEIGASPVDIARAYMGHRMSEIRHSSVTTDVGDDRALIPVDGCPSKSYLASCSHNSSIRWPGATVPDHYLTPQSQRSRYGRHDFRRTPYSRSIHSLSKSKMFQIGNDGNKSSGTESPLMKQSPSVANQQTASRSDILDGDYGSGGPVRHGRHKFAIGTPKKFVSFPLADPSWRENNLSSASLPAHRKGTDAGRIGNLLGPQLDDDRLQSLDIGVPTVPRHSSQMARKILEHLDRNYPTPKDKHTELKLATSWRKDMPRDLISVGGALASSVNREKCENVDAANLHELRGTPSSKLQSERNTIRIADAVGKRTSASDVDLRSSIPTTGANAESSNEVSKLAPTAMNVQSQNVIKKPPLSTTGKAGLPSISTQKPEFRSAFSLGNSSGFTFPVSADAALFPEPPTPSLTPPPSVANSHHMPKGEASIPSFTFGGLNKPAPALVFSFPSTSSSPVLVDTADLKFNFGSGERRVSFASIARDGVCC
ncbi:hypothetical protein SAY86_030487 [Trapa natans]|uniref:Nuclear pore complex protein NUP1 n=1 Tax=Trapa natans TaxID=22666 RepID=A0AAN7M2Z6_TRANT|nr:hypothetical protein SAY86_030487 [Trapa natans]